MGFFKGNFNYVIQLAVPLKPKSCVSWDFTVSQSPAAPASVLTYLSLTVVTRATYQEHLFYAGF